MQVDCNVEDTGIYAFPLPAIFLAPETWVAISGRRNANKVRVPPLRDYPRFKSILVVLIRNCLGTSAYVRFSVLCSKVILCLSSHLSFSCHSFPKDECGVEIDYQLFGSEEMSHGFFFSCVEGLDYQCKPFH